MAELRHLDQRVDIYRLEAQVLLAAVRTYEQALLLRPGPLPVTLVLQLKPLACVARRLEQLLAGRWPVVLRGVRCRLPPRRLRLACDELALLNQLYCAGALVSGSPEHRPPLWDIGGRLHVAAQNLSQYLEV